MTSHAPEARSDRLSPFFPAAPAFALTVALVGFSKTFFLPLVAGAFAAPAVKWAHAGLMFGWLLVFLLQTFFIRQGNFEWHRRTGFVGAAIAALMVPFTIATAVAILPRDIAEMGDGAYSAFLPSVIEALLFGSLVAAAIALRNRPDWHKRIMLLATLSILGPAWFRFRHFFPQVENPLVVFGFWLALIPMAIAVLIDVMRNRRLHPVFMTVLPAMVAIYVIEVWGSGNPLFVATAKWVAAHLS